MDKKRYRWIICAGCTLMFFCTAGLGMTGFTVYQPYLISEGGLTNAQASMLTSIRSMFSFLMMFAAVWILNKTDIRKGGTIAVLGIALSLGLYGIADSFPVYAAAAAVAGACYGLGGMLAVSVMIHRWFDEHQGVAIGICSAGSGFSAVVGTPVITWLVEQSSMKKTLFMEAAFVTVMSTIVFLVLRDTPSGEKKGVEFAAGTGKKKAGKTDMRTTPWQSTMVMAGALLMGFTYAASSHVSVLYRSEGYSAGEVSLLVSVFGAALFIGKCVYGQASDKLGSFASGNLFFGVLILGNLMTCFAAGGSMAAALGSVILIGVGSVLLSVGLTIIADTVAEPQHYAAVVRNLQIVYMLGSMCFGAVPGMIADHTGSYVPAYLLMAVFAAAAALLVQTVLFLCRKKAAKR